MTSLRTRGFGGGQQWKEHTRGGVLGTLTVPVIASTSINSNDGVETVVGDSTAAGFTVTLPLAANNIGRDITIVNRAPALNSITVAPTAPDVITGTTTSGAGVSRTYRALSAGLWQEISNTT